MYRKSDGLLYVYKYKPSIERVGSPLSPLPVFNVKPIKGDKEIVFGESDKTFNYIPINKLVHIDDLPELKKKYDDGNKK